MFLAALPLLALGFELMEYLKCQLCEVSQTDFGVLACSRISPKCG